MLPILTCVLVDENRPHTEYVPTGTSVLTVAVDAVNVRAPATPPTLAPLVRAIDPPVVGHVVPACSVITSVVASARPVTVSSAPAVSTAIVPGENPAPLPTV